MRTAAVLIVLTMAVLAGGCSIARSAPDGPWDQSWYLSTLTTPEGPLATQTPMPVEIHFRPGVGGSDGCNLFEASYEWNDPDLSWSEIVYQVPESTGQPHPCPDDALPTVELLRSAIQDGVTVTTFTAEEMVWEYKGSVFEFRPGRGL